MSATPGGTPVMAPGLPGQGRLSFRLTAGSVGPRGDVKRKLDVVESGRGEAEWKDWLYPSATSTYTLRALLSSTSNRIISL